MNRGDEFAKVMVDAGVEVENRSYLELVCALEDKGREIDRLKFELVMVSKLAADEPMFFNPLNAGHAKLIRDRVLQGEQANES